MIYGVILPPRVGNVNLTLGRGLPLERHGGFTAWWLTHALYRQGRFIVGFRDPAGDQELFPDAGKIPRRKNADVRVKHYPFLNVLYDVAPLGLFVIRRVPIPGLTPRATILRPCGPLLVCDVPPRRAPCPGTKANNCFATTQSPKGRSVVVRRGG
jgi:hypothetical protein